MTSPKAEVRLHDVLRTYMAESLGAEALRQAHADLIERWGDLHQLPDAADPAYAWRWIGYHLREAGRQGELDALLGDVPWLQTKLNAAGIAALESEFAYASDLPALTRLRRLLRNASHVLAAHPAQLPSQLLARWPRAQPGDNADSSATPLEQTLRAQAQAQIQQAGGAFPLAASLLGSEALLRTLTGHGNTVTPWRCSPTGGSLRGRDNTIKLWDPASGSCAATPWRCSPTGGSLRGPGITPSSCGIRPAGIPDRAT